VKNALIVVAAGLGAAGLYMMHKKKKKCACKKASTALSPAAGSNVELVPDIMLSQYDSSFKSNISNTKGAIVATGTAGAAATDDLDTFSATQVVD
jgi:hypothetical protein